VFAKKNDKYSYNNTSVWEARYHAINDSFDKDNVRQYYEDICQLTAINGKRIAVQRKIYYMAYQFLLRKDKEYALKFYLHYLGIKSISDSFQYKRISKINRRLLFRNSKEEENFNKICGKLLQNKDISTALAQLDRLEISQRKKIKLTVSAIKEASDKQEKIAGILGNLLSEEPESVSEPSFASPAILPVTDTKESLFLLFIDNNFKLNKKEVNIFARSHGVMKDQLIESINELYYEELDDILIDEDNEYYIMTEAYYEQIKR
jgi:hypothetical protein